MGLINDVQINGQVTFTKPVTHNYDADNSIVGSVVVGDMFSRYTSKFVQGTWNSVWDDSPTGNRSRRITMMHFIQLRLQTKAQFRNVGQSFLLTRQTLESLVKCRGRLERVM
jgi:hypothetical protein